MITREKREYFWILVKYLTRRKTYINELCEYFSEPKQVRDQLKILALHYPRFSGILKKDIDRFDEEAKRWEEHRRQKLIMLENRIKNADEEEYFACHLEDEEGLFFPSKG